MDIKITGIDTNDNNTMNAFYDTILQLYPQFSQSQINVIDDSTLEFLLSE